MAALEDIQAPPGVVLPPKEIKGTSPPTSHQEHSLHRRQLYSRRQQAT